MPITVLRAPSGFLGLTLALCPIFKKNTRNHQLENMMDEILYIFLLDGPKMKIPV
jgi:hypothetical protein